MSQTARVVTVLAGLVALCLIAVTIAVRQHDINAQADALCRFTQTAWDSRRQIVVVLSAPVEYPPTSDAALAAAQRTANEARTERLGVLLDGLGARPTC